MPDAVTADTQTGIRLISIQNPPVNALSTAVRLGLEQQLRAALADAGTRAIVIHGLGRCFSAGADIREFSGPRARPWLQEICELIEQSPKPVVAAIHGLALGGGLELAVAAHYRNAAPGTQFGLPEVNLGLLPGGGGTQRVPRLVGAAAALELMLDGRRQSAEQALSCGLIDRIAAGAGSLLDEARQWARQLADEGRPPRRSRDAQGLSDAAASLAAVEEARGRAARRLARHFAPGQILQAVTAAIQSPFEDGLRVEAEAFQACLGSPQHAGLRHAFLAELQAGKAPEAERAPARPVQRVGVIGGGTMGSGIAIAMLDAGLDVTLVERDAASAEQAGGRIAKSYARLVDAGRLSPAGKDAKMQRLSAVAGYEALAEADLVVEAVFEEMDVKKAVFAELDRVCRPGAILATNTSFLDIDEIAATISRPQDVIGLHFFSPANIMKLLEIVVPRQVADDVVATSFALAKRLGKVPIRAGVCDGFIGNRILHTYREAASFMMEDGATPYAIDQALEDFGYAMGPYRTNDLTGGDISWAARKRKAATRDPKARYVRIADLLCEQGWFGQKTGRGYYRYPDGSRTGQPDPEVLSLIAAERAARGVRPREFTADEIVSRYMAALINEAAKVLQDGIAQRPSDIDVAMVNGYGFPRWRGGPMKYADTVGLDRILAQLRAYEKEDPLFWKPAPLLIELAARQADFDSLN